MSEDNSMEVVDEAQVEETQRIEKRASTQMQAPLRVVSSELFIHPENQEVHRFLHDAYSGGGGFRGVSDRNNANAALEQPTIYTYLPYAPGENNYPNRIDKAVYFNDYKRIVDSLYKPIFNNKITIEVNDSDGKSIEGSTPRIEWAKDCNGYGWGIDQYLEAMDRNIGIYNFSINIMELQEGEAFLVNRNWNEIYHWYFEGKELKSITFRANLEELQKFTKEQSGEKLVRYKLDPQAQKEYYYKKDGKDEVILVEKYLIDILPIQVLNYDTPQNPYDLFEPRPQQLDIGKAAWYLWFRASVKDRVLDKQGFDMPFFPSGTTQVQGLEGLEVAHDTKFTPICLSPDAEKPRVHGENIQDAKRAFKEMVARFGVDIVESTDSEESGKAKSYRYEAKVETLQKMVYINKRAVEWMNSMLNLYFSEDVYLSVTTKEDFTPQTSLTVDEILKMSALFKEYKLQNSIQALLSQTIVKHFSGMARQKLEGLIDETDTINLNEKGIDDGIS